MMKHPLKFKTIFNEYVLFLKNFADVYYFQQLKYDLKL
jgi:hypothetical protein